jgi:hypothetical protein
MAQGEHRLPTLLKRVAVNDPVEGIDLGYLAALCGSHEDSRSFPEAAVTLAVDGVTVLMNLKKH